MKLIATAVFAMFLGVVSVGVAPSSVSAHDGEDHKEATTVAAEAEMTYDYVAQAGDSYSLIARKAVQTYGLKTKTNLSLGQILFVETHLTQAAGSPMLTMGEKVSLKESTIKSWVQKAQKLTAAQKEAWQAYVQYADFNTNGVGETKQA